jgi:hypothetical protein
VSVRASQLIIERAHGQPPDRSESHVTLRGDDGGKIELVFVKPQPQPDDDPDYRRVVH